MNRKTFRPLVAMALAVALALALAAPAAAAPADGGSAIVSPAALWQRLNDWIDALFAASEAGPEMDPDGVVAGPDMDPDGMEAGPGMDPNGGQNDAGPEMDPDG